MQPRPRDADGLGGVRARARGFARRPRINGYRWCIVNDSVTLARFKLSDQLERLRVEAGLAPHGRSSSTVTLESGAKFVLMAFRAGAELKRHFVPGAISIVLLEGRVMFTAQEQQVVLEPHDLLTLSPRVPHAVNALEDSAVLLTVFAA